MKTQHAGRQRGQITIIAAVLMIGLLGIVGLAIDAGMAYVTKAKLNAAVDSAAIAAARAVTNGSTQAAQAASARQAAQDFFYANFTSGYLRAVPTLATPTVSFDTPTAGAVTIGISATATMPLTLMKVLGFNNVAVAATSTTIRKDLDMAFVMDTSGSMASVGSQVQAGAIAFLNQFNTTTDRVALIHFSYGAVVDDPINTSARGFNRPLMTKHINAFNFTGNTNYAEGMWNARDQLNGIATANRSSLRVIVFFSDGSPNSLASNYQLKSGGNSGYCNGTLITGDGGGTGTPGGFYQIAAQNNSMTGGCDTSNFPTNRKTFSSYMNSTGIPTYYNAHNVADTQFRIVGGGPRTVSNSASSDAILWTNINRASKNVPQAMANQSRSEGMYIFTLGLGSNLTTPGFDGEKGQDLLKCMANTADSNCYNASQPVGVYCFAATTNDLKPCFAKLASEILRIAK